MDKKIVIFHLRNPYGIDDITFRESRLFAANELERLYANEEKTTETLIRLEEKISNVLNKYSFTDSSNKE